MSTGPSHSDLGNIAYKKSSLNHLRRIDDVMRQQLGSIWCCHRQLTGTLLMYRWMYRNGSKGRGVRSQPSGCTTALFSNLPLNCPDGECLL